MAQQQTSTSGFRQAWMILSVILSCISLIGVGYGAGRVLPIMQKDIEHNSEQIDSQRIDIHKNTANLYRMQVMQAEITTEIKNISATLCDIKEYMRNAQRETGH